MLVYASAAPLPVLIGSTGGQVYGAGQWLEVKHGARSRRERRKLRLTVDAESCMIVAHTFTDHETDHPSLLDQIDGEINRVTAGAASDGAPIVRNDFPVWCRHRRGDRAPGNSCT